jgi:nitroreductase
MTTTAEEIAPVPHLDVWDINESDYPESGSPGARLRFLLRYAILAPSSHNTQPWMFDIQDNTIDVYADLSRNLEVTDPDNRQLIIACGCALFHLKVAMEHFGHRAEVQRFPDPDNPELLARVVVGPQCFSDDHNEMLFAAITERRTYRQLFRSDPIPPEITLDLSAAAYAESSWLQFVEFRNQREHLADLIAKGDRKQWASTDFRRELARWVHGSSNQEDAGIPSSSMNHDDILSTAEASTLRTFDLGNGKAAMDHDIARHSPGLCVIGSDLDNPSAWLETGEALEHVLLLARHHHIYASFLDQPIEVPELRSGLARLIGKDGFPQIILRLGYGSHVKPTPRRSVQDVLY